MIIRSLFCLFFALAALSGCGLIYKQNIQQGNALEDEDLDELYIGMNQRQVLFVLGTPSIKDPFHQERWDYVQTFSRRGGKIVQKTVTLRFEDDVLAEIIGRDEPFEPAPDSDGATPLAGKSEQDPQEAAVQAAGDEILDTSPRIEALGERKARDREYDEGKPPEETAPEESPAPEADD